jgi:hypothetical protein
MAKYGITDEMIDAALRAYWGEPTRKDWTIKARLAMRDALTSVASSRRRRKSVNDGETQNGESNG